MSIEKKINVMLIVGGDSTERDVSLDSCKSIYQAIRDLGHQVVVADPLHPEVRPTEDPAAFFNDARINSEPPELGPERYIARKNFMTILNEFEILGCDIVFNGLHGGAGEDGTFQAVLDYLGIPYTGSGASASMLAMNKQLSKRIVSHNNVPVAKQLFVEPPGHNNIPDIENRVMKTPSLPAVVKPNQEGSSVGVTIVHTKEQLAKAIEEASRFGGPYLIEEFIDGLEVTAARLDGVELPLLEIRPKDGFYDYRNKYTSGACDYIVPAPFDEKVTDAILRSAGAAYKALGCKGYARVDFRLTPEGDHYFLEVNTLPGMTSNSLVPKAAKAVGIEFPELIDRILHLSLPNQRL
ncbi:MAG: D-alanine--D-alanine ligase [Candidatus Latescibacterota bacterium]|nr:MAG: D-alanine--D-alanine ligase [Candidatus Latescibacterota bacterium]